MKWPSNPIRVFALICVAATSALFSYLAIWLIEIVSSPDWCGKALQAERMSNQNFGGLTACVEIMKLQVGSLAKALLIVIGTFALCLGVLMVIVVAGARLAGKLFGNEIDVSRQGNETSATKAARQVAGAAVEEAQTVAAEQPKGAQTAPGEDG